jgi:hypothetical protein
MRASSSDQKKTLFIQVLDPPLVGLEGRSFGEPTGIALEHLPKETLGHRHHPPTHT